MGCDIHICAEMKHDDQWQSIDSWKYCNGWCGEEGYFRPEPEVWEGRYYSLFGKLANVRGRGAPIPPKGLPNDASDPVMAYWKIGEVDSWHTPTWLTLAELESIIPDEIVECDECKDCKYKIWYNQYCFEDDDDEYYVNFNIRQMIDNTKELVRNNLRRSFWSEGDIEDWIENNMGKIR